MGNNTNNNGNGKKNGDDDNRSENSELSQTSDVEPLEDDDCGDEEEK